MLQRKKSFLPFSLKMLRWWPTWPKAKCDRNRHPGSLIWGHILVCITLVNDKAWMCSLREWAEAKALCWCNYEAIIVMISCETCHCYVKAETKGWALITFSTSFQIKLNKEQECARERRDEDSEEIMELVLRTGQSSVLKCHHLCLFTFVDSKAHRDYDRMFTKCIWRN